MAEGLLKAELRRRGCSDIRVSSSGTWAGAGYPATEGAIAAMARRHIDLSGHVSRPLDRQDVADADVVVAMTSAHVEEVLELVPDAKDKVIMLNEVAEVALENSAADARSRLAAMLDAPRPASREGLDVEDPIGRSAGDYRACADELQAGVMLLADVLCGGIQPAIGSPS